MATFSLPATGYEFKLQGAYAVTILNTWRQPFALWFTTGDNAGQGAELSRTTTVDRTTGKVVLDSAMTNSITAGDRLRAWDSRIIFEYDWASASGTLRLSPSIRALHPFLSVGGGSALSTQQWYQIVMMAQNGIDICPSSGTDDTTVRIVSGDDAIAGYTPPPLPGA
jgi:hypothetical protein